MSKEPKKQVSGGVMKPGEKKELILWARKQRILKLKVPGLEIEFSPLAFLLDEDEQTSVSETAKAQAPKSKKTEEYNNPDLMIDSLTDEELEAQKREEEELLNWSSLP